MIREEIFLFLQEIFIAKDDDIKSLFEDTDFLCEFALTVESFKYFIFKVAKNQSDNMSITLILFNNVLSVIGRRVCAVDCRREALAGASFRIELATHYRTRA